MNALFEEEWQDEAACRGPHVDVFFPPPRNERREERFAREQRAKAICVQCAVTEECLNHALTARENHGVWGGTNEIERRQILDQ